MHTSLETKALGLAVLAGALSLGGAWLTALAVPSLVAAPTEESPATANSATPELLAQGQEFFGQSCSQCHGDDATGDEGPNLHNLTMSNGRIAATIKKGIKGEMPTFAKKYNDQQIGVLVTYLRSLH